MLPQSHVQLSLTTLSNQAGWTAHPAVGNYCCAGAVINGTARKSNVVVYADDTQLITYPKCQWHTPKLCDQRLQAHALPPFAFIIFNHKAVAVLAKDES